MTSEYDVVVLTQALPESGLREGDLGTVVHIHGQGEAFEVEFATMDGATAALVTLKPAQFRPLNGRRDMYHVRDWESGQREAA
jgi:hypothetical protein